MAPHAETTSEYMPPISKMVSQGQVEAVTDTTGVAIPEPVTQLNPTQTRFAPNDVLPHRTTSKTGMAKSIAPFSSAEMFKSPQALSKPKASKSFCDSHLSIEAKARKPSSLKDALKLFKPETISLCGGLPSSEYFPFEELSFEIPTSPAFVPSQTKTLRARKHDVAEGKSDFDLHIALNYGQSMGPPQLMRFLTEHTEIVHAPPYSNWEICLTQGSTSGLDIAIRMLCARGDALLTEEYSFSSAIETALPIGIIPVGIKMDDKGLCPTNLEYVLSNWHDGAQLGKNKYGGARKPKVMYTVPTGGNPTGATQDLQRRKDILAVCEKHDVFIIEDEPYYFLQMDEYVSKVGQNGHRDGDADSNSHLADNAPKDLGEFVKALIPSYLNLSTTGNVLRLDSFSKIIAPGTRVGWVTGPADLVSNFVRATGLSAQIPSGFSTMALYKLLEEEWGHEGFLRWVQKLRADYGRRRDGIVAACEEYLPGDYVRFVAPTAGMFHWLRVDASKHPLWVQKSPSVHTESEKRALLNEIEGQIFLTAAQNNVLIARGSWFRAEKDNQNLALEQVNGVTNGIRNGEEAPAEEVDASIYFRMTFAAAPQDKIAEAVRRFAETLKEEFSSS